MHIALSWIQNHWGWWEALGLFGQSMFFMRFGWQWIVSERHKKSVIPEAFWYFSLGGGIILFIYAIHINSLVFALGQGMGLLIYMRNIYFVWRHKKKARK